MRLFLLWWRQFFLLIFLNKKYLYTLYIYSVCCVWGKMKVKRYFPLFYPPQKESISFFYTLYIYGGSIIYILSVCCIYMRVVVFTFFFLYLLFTCLPVYHWTTDYRQWWLPHFFYSCVIFVKSDFYLLFFLCEYIFFIL